MKYIQENFKNVDDWAINFTMIKSKRIELKKLPDNRKVDCVNISLLPFKDGIEDLFKKMADCLVETL